MTQSIAVIVSLLAGLAAGALIASFGAQGLEQAALAIRPIGELWLSALQMTVLPLVLALLITNIASASDTAANGRLAARALITFLVLLTLAGVFSALVTPLLLALWPVDEGAAASLRAGLLDGSHSSVPTAPPFAEWVRNIIPTNPFAAASEGAILQVVVFAVLFGLAASRLEVRLRAPLLAFFEAVMHTMLTLVTWVLWIAPLGIFVLALGVGLRGGVGAAGAIGQYVALMSIVAVLIAVLAYVIAVSFGRAPLGRFARAAAPAQAVGFSTQSSLASLPAMLKGAQECLGAPARVAGIVLPLAVSLFRMTSPPVNLAVVLFVAHVYGVEIGPMQLAAGVFVCIVTSLGVVSLPSALTFYTTTVPISFAMGVPVELLSLLIAVEVFPDLFRTVGNVTADLAATTVIARAQEAEEMSARSA